MKHMKFISISLLGMMCAALLSCGGENNTNTPAADNAPAVPEAQTAPAAPADSNQTANPTAQTANAAQALPQAVNDFVQKYFPGTNIVGVETDNDHGGVEYDIVLNDGTEIDFDANNQWDNVDCHTKAVPAALVPDAIAAYVKANYQSLVITKIDKDLAGYEIELSNRLDLKFNKAGQFIGIDD